MREAGSQSRVVFRIHDWPSSRLVEHIELDLGQHGAIIGVLKEWQHQVPHVLVEGAQVLLKGLLHLLQKIALALIIPCSIRDLMHYTVIVWRRTLAKQWRCLLCDESQQWTMAIFL
jgi:hypothetical protein